MPKTGGTGSARSRPHTRAARRGATNTNQRAIQAWLNRALKEQKKNLPSHEEMELEAGSPS